MDRKNKVNKKLKDKYHNDIEYREKKKQVAIQHYYNKKYSVNSNKIEIIEKPVTLYFN